MWSSTKGGRVNRAGPPRLFTKLRAPPSLSKMTSKFIPIVCPWLGGLMLSADQGRKISVTQPLSVSVDALTLPSTVVAHLIPVVVRKASTGSPHDTTSGAPRAPSPRTNLHRRTLPPPLTG